MSAAHEEGCYVALTSGLLRVQEVMDRVRSPEAGAIVIFAGEETSSPSRNLLSSWLISTRHRNDTG